MSVKFLWLLCLGLCLGYEEEEENKKLPRPSLSAWPSSVVKLKSNVTLRCQAHFQNVTITLGKLHDAGYKQEQISAENKAEFPLTALQPGDAGVYFCAYKTTASHEWSEQSRHLQLVVTGSLAEPSLSVTIDPEMTPGHRTLQCLIPDNGTECIIIILLKMGTQEPLQVKKVGKNQTDFLLWNVTSKDSGNYSCVYSHCARPYLGSSPSSSLEMWVTDEHDGLRAPSLKTDSRVILVTTFSCLSLFFLFLSVLFIYRCTQNGSSGEESTKRTSHSTFSKQEAPDLSKLQKTSVLTEDPQAMTYAELNVHAPSEVAFVTDEAPPGSCEIAALDE